VSFDEDMKIDESTDRINERDEMREEGKGLENEEEEAPLIISGKRDEILSEPLIG
jgi:hypothetical protein